MMNKKVYITPNVKVVNMVSTIHMLAGSEELNTKAIHSHSRSQDSWDDDEEEEDSMWK